MRKVLNALKLTVFLVALLGTAAGGAVMLFGHGNPEICRLVVQSSELPPGYDHLKFDTSGFNFDRGAAERAGITDRCWWTYDDDQPGSVTTNTGLTVYGSETQARAAFAAEIERMSYLEGAKVLSVSGLGGESYAREITAISGYRGCVFIWRQGKYVAQIRVSGPSDAVSAPDVEALARKVQARLKQTGD